MLTVVEDVILDGVEDDLCDEGEQCDDDEADVARLGIALDFVQLHCL